MKHVAFIPKRNKTSRSWWAHLGFPTLDLYEEWVPHFCGICCLKMIADTHGRANTLSFYALLARCVNLEGFRIDDGEISGVYHHPLLELAREIGLDGVVFNHADVDMIRDHVRKGQYVILSIDLNRSAFAVKGNHLILVYDITPDGSFIVHDCAQIFGNNGEGAIINPLTLQELSNNRGIIMWPSKVPH